MDKLIKEIKDEVAQAKVAVTYGGYPIPIINHLDTAMEKLNALEKRLQESTEVKAQ